MEPHENRSSRILAVSMKSGLEGRNNDESLRDLLGEDARVSMKSGLEGRNNDP